MGVLALSLLNKQLPIQKKESASPEVRVVTVNFLARKWSRETPKQTMVN